MAANLLVALSAAGGGGWREQATSSALGRPTGESAPLSPHRLIIHRHINVTIRPVAHTAAALETASQDQAATASPRFSPDDALAQRNGSCRFEAGVDYDRGGGGRARAIGVASKEACCALCSERPSCGVATYLAASQQCWFKPVGATRRPSKSGSGVVSCVLWALEANGDDSTRVIPDDRKDAEMNKEKESLPFASSAGAALSPHRLRIHRHINVTIRPVAHAAVALETASQDQAATASPRFSPDDALAQRNGSCRFEAGVDYDRGGRGRAHATGVASKEACCALCKERPSCGVATYLAAFQQCWFKPLDATRRPSQSNAGVVSCIPHVGVANATAATMLLPPSPPSRLGHIPLPPPPTVRQSAATPQPDNPPSPTEVDLLLRPIATSPPPLSIVRSCTAAPAPLTKWRSEFTTGKAVEMSSELFFSKTLSAIPSDENASIVIFDNCPYSRHITKKTRDPFGAARRTIEGLGRNVARLVIQGKGCVLLALHPNSYPTIHSGAARYCTALVEDKTISGNDRDIVVPAGAIDYGIGTKNRRCTLTYFGNADRSLSAEFQNIRSRVKSAMLRLTTFPDACVVSTSERREYVRGISDSKFCFALPGDTMGGEKLALAVMQGCVPVIEHYSWRHQPFFDFLNYSRFAVRMPKAWDAEELLTRLRASDWKQYQRNLRMARHWFDYTRHSEAVSPYTLIWTQVSEIWA